MGDGVHLAVALDGSGWHVDAPDPARFTAGYWVDLVREAERGLLDFVTFEDDLGPEGRLDAVLVASRVAPLTERIGLVPTVVTTHTEPFHLSKAIATLDYVSNGRAGARIRISASPAAAKHFGRRTSTGEFAPELFAEAGDYVEVMRRLWDSWEDDAEIRDAATGRFVDRDKLHYVDFVGEWFSVKGPSITPRPPQGQPPIAVLSHGLPQVVQLVREQADIVFTTPHTLYQVADHPGVHHFVDIVVSFGRPAESVDALVFDGTPHQLADLLVEWHRAGVAGFRLRPAALPGDLKRIVDELVPELQRRGVFRDRYETTTLRGHLGLPRPANRYAA